MRQELIIDGKPVDLEQTSVPLNFACSEISDLSGISGNYSMTIKLPLTGTNIMAAYFANLPQTPPVNLWPGYKTLASYFVDGIPIFQNAVAKLQSTSTSIDLTVTFGTLTWLAILETIKLQDLDMKINWDYQTILDQVNDVFPLADYGGTFQWEDNNGTVCPDRLLPAVRLSDISHAIYNYVLANKGIDLGQNFYDLVEYDRMIPCLDRLLNPALPYKIRFDLDEDLLIVDDSLSMNTLANIWFYGPFTTDSPQSYYTKTAGGLTDKYFICPKDGKYRIQAQLDMEDFYFIGVDDQISLRFYLEEQQKGAARQTTIYGRIYYHGDHQVNQVLIDDAWDFKKGDVLRLKLEASQSMGAGYPGQLLLKDSTWMSIEYQPSANKENVEFLMPFDLAYNLPDWTAKDFIKACMQLRGLLVEQNTRTNQPEFFAFEDVLAADPVDWSGKVVEIRKPKIEWNLGMKQTNHLKYTEDQVSADASFQSLETDDQEQTVLTLPFAASADQTLRDELPGLDYLQVVSIPQWVLDNSSPFAANWAWKWEGKCKPRIFNVYPYWGKTTTPPSYPSQTLQINPLFGEPLSGMLLYNNACLASWFSVVPTTPYNSAYATLALDMQTLMEQKYQAYIQAVKSNRLFTFNMVLQNRDVAAFSHRSPVYLLEFAALFFCKKIISWLAGAPCDVEMLALKQKDASPVVRHYGQLYNQHAVNKQQVDVEYGMLYNHYAVVDSRNIAPAGWHVPTQTEWLALRSYINPSPPPYDSGGQLKETGLDHWTTPNLGATDVWGFTARGNGCRRFDTGVFQALKDICYFWTATAKDSNQAYFCETNYNSEYLSSGYFSKKFGFALRCIKDDSTAVQTMTGNDGKTYPCVKIGNQVWMAANSCETRYRNGDAITEVTDGSAWIALTSAARCSYDNTESNAFALLEVFAPAGWHVPSDAEINTLAAALEDVQDVLPLSLGWRNSDGEFTADDELQIWTSQEGRAAVFTPTGVQTLDLDPNCGLAVRLIKDDNVDPTEQPEDLDGNTYPWIRVGDQIWMTANFKCRQYSDGQPIPNITSNSAWAALDQGARCAFNNNDLTD